MEAWTEQTKDALGDSGASEPITNSEEGALEVWVEPTIIVLPNRTRIRVEKKCKKEIPCFYKGEHIGTRVITFILWPEARITILSEHALCEGKKYGIWRVDSGMALVCRKTGKIVMTGYFDAKTKLYYFPLTKE